LGHDILRRWLSLSIESAFLSRRKSFIPKALWAKPILSKNAAGLSILMGLVRR
jgi:hypothetical protein